jgi:hypothetical protein
MRTEVWRYVSWEDLEDYLRLGWLPTALPEPHGHYRCGVVWRCPCPCLEPQSDGHLPATRVATPQLIGDPEPHTFQPPDPLEIVSASNGSPTGNGNS